MKAKAIDLPEDYAIVMQQIKENGEEDFTNLAETLQFDRPRLVHIVQGLQHKGLISITRASSEIWLRLSGKGQRLMAFMWPEAMAA